MMLCMTETTARRPGRNLIQVGLLLVVIGVILAMLSASSGGDGRLMWVSAAGLLMAGIGFAQRLLAAVEK